MEKSPATQRPSKWPAHHNRLHGSHRQRTAHCANRLQTTTTLLQRTQPRLSGRPSRRWLRPNSRGRRRPRARCLRAGRVRSRLYFICGLWCGDYGALTQKQRALRHTGHKVPCCVYSRRLWWPRPHAAEILDLAFYPFKNPIFHVGKAQIGCHINNTWVQ